MDSKGVRNMQSIPAVVNKHNTARVASCWFVIYYGRYMVTGCFSRIYRILQIFQAVLFQKTLTFIPHTSWYRYQLRCYPTGSAVYQGWVRLSHYCLLCYCSSGISSCLKCVIWAIKYIANAAVHCTSLTGCASYRFIIGIKIWLFCHTDIICISSVFYFHRWQMIILSHGHHLH